MEGEFLLSVRGKKQMEHGALKEETRLQHEAVAYMAPSGRMDQHELSSIKE